MKKCVFLFVIATLLASFGCAGAGAYSPGEVYAVSFWGRNDPAYTHLMFAAHSAATKVSRLDPAALYREMGLQMFNFSDGIEIKIIGEGAGEPRYALYSAQGDEIYAYRSELLLPEEPGIYFLCVELVWTDGRIRWGYQYFFCMSK